MSASFEGEKLWSYWHKQLSGELPVLNLPTDRPRSPIQTYHGASHAFYLDEKLTQQLKILAKSEKTTLYGVILATFQVLLYRYTGQEDILVACPTVGRSRPEFAQIVGYFANPVVLRANLAGNATFKEFLNQVRQTLLAAIDHQDYPFSQLVNQLVPNRDAGRSPITDVMFVLEKSHLFEVERLTQTEQPGGLSSLGMQLDLGELILESYPLEWRVARCDLDLLMVEAGETLSGSIQYNTDLFNADTIARMVGHFQTLLESIVDNPDQQLHDLPLLTEAERYQYLVEWNDTKKDYPQHLYIHQLFEAQVERTPDAIALICKDKQLSYRELNQQANQLAHYLQRLGVVPEMRVGVCVERSPEILIGLLAILKAGGAYVPLDPEYPKDRLAFMLEDAQISILLTKKQILEDLPQHSVKLVFLDTDSIGRLNTENNQANLTCNLQPENLAYMVYTSGTTGKPKAVMAEQRNLLNYILTTQDKFKFHAQDVVPCLASFAFSISLFELLTPLLSGGQVNLLTLQQILALQQLLTELKQVSCFHTTPGLMRRVLAFIKENTGEDKSYININKILIGGDLVPPDLLAEIKLIFSESDIHVLYGCSEVSTLCSSYLVPPTSPKKKSIIGKPLNNVCLRLCDRHQNLVPINVVGEIYVGGAGVTRGYAHREDLTQEKYIILDNQRFYKTGDLGRYLPDGNIEFLGRSDYQVKIRGFRIESGEIEATLNQHPTVQESIVLAWEDVPGNKRLAAYIVFKQQAEASTSQLRQYLQEKLPKYMIPAVFLPLKALPLTPNRKVDRQALPTPEINRSELAPTFVPAHTPVEEVLTRIWAEVLGLEEIGIHDNFFELGGHSLLATQVISRVREALQIELPLRHLFESPTVAGLAANIETNHQSKQRQTPPIIPAPRDRDLPLSFAQHRLWFLQELEPESPVYNIPAALSLNGLLNIAALERSLREIVRRHEILRTSFVTVNGQPTQVIHQSVTLNLPVIDLRGLVGVERQAQAQRLATNEAQQTFDLTKVPLIRTTLLQLDEQEYWLLLTIHHIVADGWSMGIFIEELATLYKTLSEGRPSLLDPLPELAIQYADFAHWQQQWLQGEVLETQLAYWKQQLTGVQSVLALSSDRPRPPVQSYRGKTEPFLLPIDLVNKLKNLSQREGATLFMTLLATLQILLYRYTGQEDIVVGSPIANRTSFEIENLIGCFLNNLILRGDLSGAPTFRELLKRVREVTLAAYANQDLPIEKVVEHLHHKRDLSHAPLFQVLFVLQNAPMPSLELAGLTLEILDNDPGIARLDLEFQLWETPEGIKALLVYSTDLFDRATITRMLGHFQTLLAGVVANPEQQIGYLPLLTPSESHQLLQQWNHSQINYLNNLCIDELFAQQVELTPDAVAVVFAHKHLTYKELNDRANQLAHYLQYWGVSPGVMVGICVERSVEMVIGLLGILKAGGAYIPLDPAYPPDRLAYMLNDSQVSVLLTQERLVSQLPKHQARVVNLDTDWQIISQQSNKNPVSQVIPENLVYVIYTSGSTGTPKGVMVQHQSLVNFTETAIVEYGHTIGDRILQFASISFDTAAEEIYPCLLSGGTLVLRTDEMLSSIPIFLQNCRDWEITVLDLPTAYWHQMIAEIAIAKLVLPQSVRLVIIGGEQALPERIEIWQKYVGLHPQLINTYGPTEATVVSTMYKLSASTADISIGKPIRNVQVYVLDQYLQPLPIGVPGELHIAGAGLARGYLNRPELTEEKFIPNPFSHEKGDRLYKTGDLARYLSDGNIELIGRIDHQVKIRGFRIELEEITAVLGKHQNVIHTVVTAWEEQPGNNCLIAYVVLKHQHSTSINELQVFLRSKLPEYMLPTAFIVLETLPLTPNGKVDRKALPQPNRDRWQFSQTFVPPCTDTEKTVAQIWSVILKLEQVGIHNNFFELGGHSLLATQVISRLKEKFQIDLPLRRLFEMPTVTGLAQLIEQIQKTNNQLTYSTIVPVSRESYRVKRSTLKQDQ